MMGNKDMHLLSPAPTQTPPDYSRIPFDLPEDKFVGVLACQRDPLLSELETTLISINKKESLSSDPKDKNGKKGKKVSVEAQFEEWEAVFKDTIVFPEGGGQPNDVGVMTWENYSLDIHNCIRRGLTATHILFVPPDLVARLPTPGSKVHLSISLERRWDHMLQHTGQHLLSAHFDKISLPTLAWTLSPFPQLSYIELPRRPTHEELKLVEDECTRSIAEGKGIFVEFYAGHSVADTVDGFGKIPKDYDISSGVVRKVIISDVDPGNCCCGTHFPTLSPLNAVYVHPYTTNVRGTNSRVYFLVGSTRINTYLRNFEALVKDSSLAIGCSNTDLVTRVRGLLDESKQRRTESKKLRDELAIYWARDIVKEWRESEGKKKVWHRTNEITNDVDFLNLTLAVLTNEYLKDEKFTLALSTSNPSDAKPNGSVLVVSSPEQKELSNKMKEKFGSKLRGGGKGRWSGKVVEGKWGTKDVEILDELLNSLDL